MLYLPIKEKTAEPPFKRNKKTWFRFFERQAFLGSSAPFSPLEKMVNVTSE
jgi:hypothetical protein